MKLRYVPSSLPDMLGLADDGPEDEARTGQPERVLGGFRLGEMDVEIAMPVQTLEDLSGGTGLWTGADPRLRRRQLAHMAATCAEVFPTLRLHLFDGRTTFAAPFTVFGRIRAALYLGEAYLVVTSTDQVAALSRLFDNLVRRVAGRAGAGARDALRPRRGHALILLWDRRILRLTSGTRRTGPTTGRARKTTGSKMNALKSATALGLVLAGVATLAGLRPGPGADRRRQGGRDADDHRAAARLVQLRRRDRGLQGQVRPRGQRAEPGRRLGRRARGDPRQQGQHRPAGARRASTSASPSARRPRTRG